MKTIAGFRQQCGEMSTKKLLFVFFFLLFLLSFFKVFRITTKESSLSLPNKLANLCVQQNQSFVEQKQHAFKTHKHLPVREDILSLKERNLLLDRISKRVPCNILFFGLRYEFLNLSEINSGGSTVFLEDNIEKLKIPKTKGVKVYYVKYQSKASKAYELLKHARENPDCMSNKRLIDQSSCKLAMRKLPEQIHKKKWDVVVIDGPVGDQLEAMGRMEAIYSAAVLARAGNVTDVFVHDVDRTIEKWYSWEFLCDEYLVSAKGKLWHFRIRGGSESTGFCPAGENQIL